MADRCLMPNAAAVEAFEVRFTVPGQPRAQQRTHSRVVRLASGKLTSMHYTPAQSVSEQNGVRYLAAAAMRGRDPMDGPIALYACFYIPVPRSWSRKRQEAALHGEIFPASRPDLDNYFKLVADAMNKVVWRDDGCVVRAIIDKLYSARQRVDILVRSRTAADFPLFPPDEGHSPSADLAHRLTAAPLLALA